MMNSLISKWGSIVIVIIIAGILLLSLVNSASGISTWISDTYLPKKYLIIEYAGMRFIMYGQFSDTHKGGKYDNNQTSGNYVFKLIQEIKTITPIERKYTYPIDISVDANFNSRQIRSSDRNGPTTKE